MLTFLVVENLTLVVLGNRLGTQVVVGDLTDDLLVILTIVSEHTEQSRTTGSRSTQNQNHLSLLTASIHRKEDRLGHCLGSGASVGALADPEERVDKVEQGQEGISCGGNELLAHTLSDNAQLLPHDSHRLALESLGLRSRDDLILEVGLVVKITLLLDLFVMSKTGLLLLLLFTRAPASDDWWFGRPGAAATRHLRQ